jgi:hypothetical protein
MSTTCGACLAKRPAPTRSSSAIGDTSSSTVPVIRFDWSVETNRTSRDFAISGWRTSPFSRERLSHQRPSIVPSLPGLFGPDGAIAMVDLFAIALRGGRMVLHIERNRLATIAAILAKTYRARHRR